VLRTCLSPRPVAEQRRLSLVIVRVGVRPALPDSPGESSPIGQSGFDICRHLGNGKLVDLGL
jgi:hypothetical protein